ncbi:hypothetical protein GWO13_04925 [Candidatus Bathyarchaeota archaeon]|nr:hypothetical protein [Candidatus Bathyarchaeota archaeon]
MVFPAILTGIFGGKGGALSKGLTGLLQGGGFGIGYGFGVRLGYDMYGGIKKALGLDSPEKAKNKMQTFRYSQHPFFSHLGSGSMMALNRVIK